MNRLITLLACVVAGASFADMCAYQDVKTIRAESDQLLAVHFHDWQDSPAIQDLEKPDLPFSEENRWAYIELWDKQTGEKLWRKPSPAFTYLWVSPDGEYIVGMSRIMFCNPYQLVVFDKKGRTLLREHVTPEKAVFTSRELAAFWKKYPDAKTHLAARIKTIDGKHYVDFMNMWPDTFPKGARGALREKAAVSPEFPWVSESVTNWVEWFDEEPELKIIEKKGETYLEYSITPDSLDEKEPAPRKRVLVRITNQMSAAAPE